MALDQEGFRWRDNNGPEEGSPGASYLAAQDTNISVALDTPVRLRVLVNHASGAAPGASNYRLEYRKVESPTPNWAEVEPRGSPDSTGRVRLALSQYITAGGENTTAQLAAPAGSPKSFTAGRIWDDESGQDSITIGADQYTELEFCVEAVSANGAAASDVYEFRVTRALAATGDSLFSSVVLLAINESGGGSPNTFDDQSSYNHAITSVAEAQWDQNPANVPSGLTSVLKTDGTGDWLSVANNAALNLGSSIWTIEFFINLIGTGTGVILIAKSTTGSNRSYYLRKTSGDRVRFVASSDGTAADIGPDVEITNAALNAGTWYYIAISRTGDTTGEFAWGTTGATTTGSWTPGSGAIIDQNAPLTIGGGTDDAAGDSANARFAAVRITKGANRTITTVPPLPFASS